uniref:Uncharacterized protein n=1 Tax=Anas platyrhynchos TaxID=8839 RepID=A0A8B9ZK79_ANAPL
MHKTCVPLLPGLTSPASNPSLPAPKHQQLLLLPAPSPVQLSRCSQSFLLPCPRPAAPTGARHRATAPLPARQQEEGGSRAAETQNHGRTGCESAQTGWLGRKALLTPLPYCQPSPAPPWPISAPKIPVDWQITHTMPHKQPHTPPAAPDPPPEAAPTSPSHAALELKLTSKMKCPLNSRQKNLRAHRYHFSGPAESCPGLPRANKPRAAPRCDHQELRPTGGQALPLAAPTLLPGGL